MKSGIYSISIAAKILNVHPQSLRLYERLGLISPARTRGNVRLYSEEDLSRVRIIRELTQDLGINLAGVDMVLKFLDRIRELEEEVERLRAALGEEKQFFSHAPPPPRRLFSLPPPHLRKEDFEDI